MKVTAHRPLRGLWLWALLVPFLLLSLVPRGVMPGPAAAGGMTLVLCAGDGTVALAVDPATMQPLGDAPAPQDHRCTWAAAQIDLALSHPAVLPVPSDVALAPSPRRILAPVAAPVRRNGLPPATGPPSPV